MAASSRRYAPGGQAFSGLTPFVEKILALGAVNSLHARLAQVCDVIACKAALIITVVDALQSLRTVEAVRCSLAVGQTVAVQVLS